jgi:hypothetical protein
LLQPKNTFWPVSADRHIFIGMDHQPVLAVMHRH